MPIEFLPQLLQRCHGRLTGHANGRLLLLPKVCIPIFPFRHHARKQLTDHANPSTPPLCLRDIANEGALCSLDLEGNRCEAHSVAVPRQRQAVAELDQDQESELQSEGRAGELFERA